MSRYVHGFGRDDAQLNNRPQSRFPKISGLGAAGFSPPTVQLVSRVATMAGQAAGAPYCPDRWSVRKRLCRGAAGRAVGLAGRDRAPGTLCRCHRCGYSCPGTRVMYRSWRRVHAYTGKHCLCLRGGIDDRRSDEAHVYDGCERLSR